MISHLFSPWLFWRLHPFLQLGCFCIDIASFCICILQNQLVASFAVLLLVFFCRRRRHQDLNSMDIFYDAFFTKFNTVRKLSHVFSPTGRLLCSRNLHKVTFEVYRGDLFVAELPTQGDLFVNEFSIG